ncbi:MAG: hypothetical protein N4A40_16240 [Tissierellales bacterium]|jgi:hypothetical protein|nr:hypothetical protein [Tissierellales bacterium]
MSKKRLKKILILGILSVLILTGCEKLVVKSPTELIHPPKLAVDQEELREVVDQMLPEKTQLTSGMGDKSVAAINYIDLDNDGGDEAIVFYKSQNQEYFAGVMILMHTESGWEIYDIKNEIANDVEEVYFKDVTNNGVKEIIVGYVGEQNFDNYLVIYSVQEREGVSRIFEKSYNELALADFDYDDKIEIVLFQLDRNVLAKAELYKANKGTIYFLNEYEIQDFVSNYDNIAVGNLYKDDIGIVVDFRVGVHTADSIMLKVEKNKLVNIVETNKRIDIINKLSDGNYFIKSQDIDGDGIIEVGEFIKPIGYETIMNRNIPYIERWRTWDGKDSLVFDRQSYINYDYRYRFLFPKKWNDQITIVSNDNRNVEDSKQLVYVTEDGQSLLSLYTLIVVENKQWGELEAKLKKDGKKYDVVAQNATMRYIIIDDEYELSIDKYESSFKSMKLSKEELLEGFDFLKE